MNLNRLFRTSSFRLALLYAAFFTVSVLILFAIIYWRAADFAVQDEADDIRTEFVAIQDEVRLTGDAKLSDIIANHIAQHVSDRAVYLVLDPAGTKIAGNLPTMSPQMGPMTLHGVAGRRNVPAYGFRLDDGDYLLIGQDPQSTHEMKEGIAGAFTISIAVTVLLAVIGGTFLARHALTRVDDVARASRAIMAGDLSQRLPVSGTRDEFDGLADSVNAMLERIQDLMGSVRQVTNDIAHDLRTPLTRLRHRLEQSRQKETTTEELTASISRAIDQVDGILQTFGALLRIAQIESGTPSRTSVVDLSALLKNIADDFAPVAEDKGNAFDAMVAADLAVTGEHELLTQMMANLLDNAIRHTPKGANIFLRAHRDGDKVEVSVTDSGGGIPVEERDKVLRPFYRLDGSRSTEGNGLGLSIVAAIAKRHGAVLGLSDNDPGLRVSILLPAISDAPFSELS